MLWSLHNAHKHTTLLNPANASVRESIAPSATWRSPGHGLLYTTSDRWHTVQYSAAAGFSECEALGT
jgi:hypothetical protein